LELVLNEIVGIYIDWLLHYEDIVTGRKWTLGPFRNKVVQGGLENMAALLIGEHPSETAAMHVVIGSNATAAQQNDDLTDMTEVARKALSSKTRSGAMARLRAFFTSTEANGDHQCLGIVARSTDVAGTGTLLNRLVQPFSKTAGTVLTIEVRWTFQGVT
jgi:hypothetical protein